MAGNSLTLQAESPVCRYFSSCLSGPLLFKIPSSVVLYGYHVPLPKKKMNTRITLVPNGRLASHSNGD